ncbi:hypothetical protein M231_00298 [Tremella mesenterica]|uniref:Uncharacterized protein n=1 Tax=Tremella mesenterica TaxID=5217 RepID=A0A4Q1BW06_TREME|nr:hypothetical protein M231_00298 [Tremella mesenterica]
MINLRPTIHPDHQTNLNPPLILLPDRIQHPKILPRKKGPHLGILQSFHSLSIPISLPRMVLLQLQLRMQQELTTLIRRLRARPKDERGLIHRLDVSSSLITKSSSPLPGFRSSASSSIFESPGDSMAQSSGDPGDYRLGSILKIEEMEVEGSMLDQMESKPDNFLKRVNIPKDTIALFISHPQTSSNIHTNQGNEDPSIPIDDGRWGDTFIRSDGTQIPIYHIDVFPLGNNLLQELHTLSLFSQSGSTEPEEKATSQVWAIDISAPWGHLGVPLAMALWRLRMYHGYEWEQVS